MKIKTFRISFEFFKGILAEGFHPGGYTVMADAIPADAEVVNCRHSWTPGTIEIQLRSESFPEIKQGKEIPFIIPILRKEYPEFAEPRC